MAAKKNAAATKKKRRPGRSIGGVFGWICGLVLGAVMGLLVPRLIVDHIRGPKVTAVLRGEHVPGGDRPNCSYYIFRYSNFGEIEYMYAKIQLPSIVTGFRIGEYQEYGLNGSGHQGLLTWAKGYDAEGRCSINTASLMPNPDVQSGINEGIVEIHSTSRFPVGSSIIALIATTDSGLGNRVSPGLWAEGAYEYSKLGQSVRKDLPIKVEDPVYQRVP